MPAFRRNQISVRKRFQVSGRKEQVSGVSVVRLTANGIFDRCQRKVSIFRSQITVYTSSYETLQPEVSFSIKPAAPEASGWADT